MIDIENELEDIVPTYDADVDLIQLLKDSTILGTDDDGDEIPGYIFAKDLADMLEISENDMAMFAFENGYEILSAKVVGEEIPSEMLVICRKGFDQDILKTDYKKIFDLEIELTPAESFDDSKLVEMKKTETTYSSKEIQDKIDSIVNKQIPDIEERIKKYETEKASSKDDNRNRTLNNKIRGAEKQLRALSKRKEKLEIDFKTAKENEDRKNREELEARIEKEIKPGKGKRLKEKPQIKITQEEKKSYDDFIDFLQDNTVSIRFDIASKREKFFRYLLPEIKDNQYNVISGKLESGQDKKWGISAVLTVKNVHLCPDSFKDYFIRGNKITENHRVIAILITNFEVLEDKIKVSDSNSKEESLKEEITEENELKNRAKKHKKTDKKGARGWFVNPSAGNVEQNIARANHMMGDGSSASNVTVGSAPAGLGEEVELSEMLPHEDESKIEFVARFMSDDKMIKEYENPKQRYAVAMSYWEKK